MCLNPDPPPLPNFLPLPLPTPLPVPLRAPEPQENPCPSASPPSKNDMSPVPFTDDNGNLILGPDGLPMMRPAGFDPHFFTGAGAEDAAKYGQGTYYVNSLSNFRIGGSWDAQRGAKGPSNPQGQWYPEFRDYASVAIGLYAGADGFNANQINMVANLYASKNSQFTGQVMDTNFPNLPAQNVDNTSLGVTLATVGGGFGVCTGAVTK